MMATSAQHMAARGDMDLIQRFAAVAEQEGMTDASSWVANNMGQLVNQEVAGDQRISDVHAYADEVRSNYIRATPVPAGLNPGAVTDSHIRIAIEKLLELESVPVPAE